ncbi:MAG: D-alanyl-D-alanine carboxypeptidase family protein, partial [Clostridia bacterium]|nr:D-alanyl-D-alanine carboxypeptidase family protein [Clostridia bacterium]
MKKTLLIFILCLGIIASSASAFATDSPLPDDVVQDETAIDETPTEELVEIPTEYPLIVNGTVMKNSVVIRDEIHYVPLRAVFERLGSFVFYRVRDCQIYALSRDGDTIQHIVGGNTVIINGVAKTFGVSSFSENNVTYVPLEMVSAIYPTSKAYFENQQMTIQMPFTYTEYNKAVNDVLLVCKTPSFHPERFKRYLSYHVKKPASTMQDVIFTVNIGLDYPFYNNVTTIANPYDNLVLVNKYNRLPAGFKQTNLVKMDRMYTINDGKQYLMTHEAYWRFKQLSDAARKEGISIKAASTYRTEDYQGRLYNNYLRTTGRKNADNYSARPGFSEHQTGLAVDVNYTGTSFENTTAFKWLQKHAHEYGYILRYPKGKTWITGYAYEPWHYRYVGIP